MIESSGWRSWGRRLAHLLIGGVALLAGCGSLLRIDELAFHAPDEAAGSPADVHSEANAGATSALPISNEGGATGSGQSGQHGSAEGGVSAALGGRAGENELGGESAFGGEGGEGGEGKGGGGDRGDHDSLSIPVGDPTHYSRADGVDGVVSRFSNGHVYMFTQIGGWYPFDLTAEAESAVEIVGTPTPYLRGGAIDAIIARTSQNHVAELYWNGRWIFAMRSQEALSPDAAGDPVGYVRSDGYSVVTYRGTDHHIHELHLHQGTWYPYDISGTIGAPNALGNPRPFERADGTNSVIYRDVNNHLTELHLGVGWQSSDISASVAMAAPAGEPSPYVRSDERNAVVYRDADGRIHEVSWVEGEQAWSAVALSDVAESLAADSDPVGFVRADGVDAVVYRGVDQHIHVLTRSGLTWVHKKVSMGVLVASRPTPFIRADGTTAITYRATNDCLYELRLVGSVQGDTETWLNNLIYDPSSAN